MGIQNVSYGTNPLAVRIRYFYTNASGGDLTILQGEPMCFNYDSTTNVLGWGVTSLGGTHAAGTTTYEGEHNEGKFLRIENPNTGNMQWFAGVVAPGGWCGQKIANGGSAEIELYIPNGAIVPVRAYVACTVGITILAVKPAAQYLTRPELYSGTNFAAPGTERSVAIAEETNSTLASTAGLVLARLAPELFIYQNNNATPLSVAAAGTTDTIVNHINVTSAQTSGRLTALRIDATSSAGAVANAAGMCLYAQANVKASVGSHVAAVGARLFVSGGSAFEYLTSLQSTLKIAGTTSLACTGRISVLQLTSQVTDNTSAMADQNDFAWIYLEQNGTSSYGPKALIVGNSLTGLGCATAFTGDHAFTAADYGLKCYFGNDSTKTYYIPLITALV